jgi:hypothetical protein
MAWKQSKVVECDIEEIELDGDYKTSDDETVSIPSIRATCQACGHVTESYGTGHRSVTRCLVLMREGCPRGQNNRYEQ